MIQPLSFRDFFNQFGFLYGNLLNRAYKNLPLSLKNLIDINFIVKIDPDNLTKKLNNFYPIQILRRSKFHYPDEPFIHIYQSNVADYPHVSVTGKSFYSEIEAITKACFEALERYSYSDFMPNDFLEDSFENIKNNSLDIFSLAGFSEDQKNKNKIFQFNERTTFRFFKGDCLTEKNIRYIPLQLISPKYFLNTAGFRKRKWLDGKFYEPVLRSPTTTGVSAGLLKEDVIYGGMLEVIERDAFMVTYLNKMPRSLINLEKTDISINNTHIIDYFKDYNLEIYAVRLLSDMPVHTIAVFIIDRRGNGPALSMGASAHHNLKDAIIKAVGEALTNRLYNKANNTYNMNVDVPQEKFKKKERKVFWSRQENLSKIKFIIDSPKEDNVPKFEIESLNLSERIDHLVGIFKEKRYSVYYADITPPFLKKLGIEVGKVIIPEMQPMHLDEAYPFLGGERIQSVPRSTGYEAAHEINMFPHPFH